MSSLRVKYILVGNVIYVSTLQKKKFFFYVVDTRLIVCIVEIVAMLAVIIMAIDYNFFFLCYFVSGRYRVIRYENLISVLFRYFRWLLNSSSFLVIRQLHQYNVLETPILFNKSLTWLYGQCQI